jgi:ATP/ADP translocase/HEAT repeat protein
MAEQVLRATAAARRRSSDLAPMIAMMGLFFLVVCAVGILRPIKNALALDGLGDTDFYKVYLVSAAVVAFVPLYNRLADRIPWRWLIPGVAVFFAANLVLFRTIYVEGSTTFGLFFYGWYDLFAAALVTQFFMAAQLFFNARDARLAYPIVIAGGSIGATLGGAITGFFAERVGTPNLLLVAAALIVAFSVGMPIVWRAREAAATEKGRRRRRPAEKVPAGDLRSLARDPQIRLIAAMVLLTVLVKQLVDYQFNTLSKEIFQERDAISAFQGKFNAATQWLPIVALAVLQPALRRYGMAVAVMLLPVAMLFTNIGLVLFWGLWAAVAAKGAETSLRYSAERAGREILYVPVPEDVKLRAKAYIDVAVEKGIGKVASAGLIFALVSLMDYRSTAWVGLGLAALLVTLALNARREYVRTLARSIEGRFASLRGVFASLFDATTIPVVKQALAGPDPLQTAFALDLVDQASAKDMGPLAPELHALLHHNSAEIRTRALGLIQRVPSAGDAAAIRERLTDPEPSVREAAVRALCAIRQDDRQSLLAELLGAEQPVVRTATLACLARGEIGTDGLAIARQAYAVRAVPEQRSDPETRVELALAAGTLRDGDAADMLVPFLEDPDARVASTALRSAGLLELPALYPRMIDGLARASTREAARDALVAQGEKVVPALARRLLDPSADPVVRRSIPSVLAHIPSEQTVQALLRSALAPETDQLLDYRTIKALGKLRARSTSLRFDPALVGELLKREVNAGRSYLEARQALSAGDNGVVVTLLGQTLLEAWRERRETSFRTLGLVHSPEDTYRCYLAVVGTETLPRANALEWLETTLGYPGFHQLDPILTEPTDTGATRKPANPQALLEKLSSDEDPWIAHCASRAAKQLSTLNFQLSTSVMDLIEKVFLLQRVDLLRDARSAHLAMLASIAEEIDVAEGTQLLREGEPADALYIVVRGSVELRGMGGTLQAAGGTAFGTWALIDQAPSVVEGRATEATRLLRITRDDFHDLVGDHPELAIGLLQGLARRVRSLVA